MTVPRGHGQRLVSENLLDRADVHPGHDVTGGASMLERVPDDILDPDLLQSGRDTLG